MNDSATKSITFRRPDALIVLALAAAVIALYWQTTGFGYVYYDDPNYTFRNPDVETGLGKDSLHYAFTSNALSHWHPLTWLSLMLDVQLFGMSPATFHRTNVILHILSTVTLFLLLRAMTGSRWRSALAAALFALHPLRVESVAWVAERKDVLSVFLGLVAMCAYVRYVRRRTWAPYIATIIVFAMSLMAKSMLVTLPVVLLLIDYWPLRRFERERPAGLLIEKIPLFVLSTASATMTLLTATGTGAVHSMQRSPLAPRVANAIVSHLEYLLSMIWPRKLVLLYPFPEHIAPGVPLAAAALLGAFTIAAIAWARRWPHVIVGWLWFIIVLGPVNGLVSIGELSRADRYTYFPMIGILLMVIWSIPEPRKRAARRAAGAISTAIIVALSVLTWRQLQFWRDSETIFRRTLDVIGPNGTILLNYGLSFTERGDHASAERIYREAWALRPEWPPVLTNIGVELNAQDKFDQALGFFRDSLRLDPRESKTWFNMGITLMHLQRWPEAEDAFRHTVRLNPRFAPAKQNVDFTLEKQGKPLEYNTQSTTTATTTSPTSAPTTAP